MEPIRCHICNAPLKRVKYCYSPLQSTSLIDEKEFTHWKCIDDDYEDSNDYEDSGHCWITTMPKKRGILVGYSVFIQDKDKCFVLDSRMSTSSTTLQRAYRHVEDEFDINALVYDEPSVPVPRFYPLKLKEPLLPQLMSIYENVKLCLTFS
jgi:hypothetical protein